ncbi:integrase, catalytic region, zinc finger, CCHC-type containing protein [Tanacetum coccineum]
MFKLDLEPLAPRLLQNREAHINYLKYTQEQADTLQGIVEQAKAKQPLDKTLDFACKHAQRIQELLVYVRDTCPNAIKLNEKKFAVTPKNKVKKVRFAKPLTSSSNIRQVESSTTSDSNILVLSPTRLKCSTSNCGSKPTGNKKNDRISRIPSSRKKAKIVESKNANHLEPNHTWGSNATDIPSSSSLVMTCSLDCSLVSGLRMFKTYDREPLSAHELYNTTKFVNQTLREFYENVSISHQTSVACTPQHNGVFKRQDKKLDLSFFHVFGVLCYPTNDNDDLGKLDSKADIGIFIGYAPANKAFRIYNKRTWKIIETIHVTFDELTAMAFEQFSSGPELYSLTPATSNSELVPNTVSQQPCIPPPRDDWDRLSQPMFDE